MIILAFKIDKINKKNSVYLTFHTRTYQLFPFLLLLPIFITTLRPYIPAAFLVAFLPHRPDTHLPSANTPKNTNADPRILTTHSYSPPHRIIRYTKNTPPTLLYILTSLPHLLRYTLFPSVFSRHTPLTSRNTPKKTPPTITEGGVFCLFKQPIIRQQKFLPLLPYTQPYVQASCVFP